MPRAYSHRPQTLAVEVGVDLSRHHKSCFQGCIEQTHSHIDGLPLLVAPALL
jgi:hypothetical protein